MGLLENYSVKDDQLIIEKLYIVAGWELDLDTILLYPDNPHKELLQEMGYENIPDSISLLEYAQSYVFPEDVDLIRARFEHALNRRDDPSYSDRFELRLKAADNTVYYFLINSWAVRPGIIRGQGQNISDLKSMRDMIEDTSASLKAVIENTDDYIFIVKSSGELLSFNENFKNVMADFFSVYLTPGVNILEMIPSDLYAQWHPLLLAAIGGSRHVQEMDVRLQDTYHIEVAVNPIVRNEVVDSVSFFIKDITSKWRLSRLDALESKVFEKAFKSNKLKEVVDTLLHGMEQLLPDGRFYVTLRKKDALVLEWLCTPSLPPSYLSFVKEIPIDECSGSCGLAAQSMVPVLISDIREHSCWDAYREMTLLSGFQSCFSFPVISKDGVVLGTLGAYFPDIHEISDYEMNLFLRAVNVVGILIEKDQLQNEMQENSRKIEEIGAAIPGVIYIVNMDPSGVRKFEYVSDGVERYLNITKEMAMDSYESIVAFLLEEDKHKFATCLKESIQNKSLMEFEFHLCPEIKPEFHCFYVRAVHHFKDDGSVITYGSVFDITQLKLVEQNTIRKQMELEAFIKSTDDLILVVDEDHVLVDYFCKNEEMLCEKNIEFLGKKLQDVMPAELVDAYDSAKKKFSDSDNAAEFNYEVEIHNQIKYFRSRFIKVSGTGLVLVSIMDTTEQNKLNRMNDELLTILNEAGTYASFGSVEFNLSQRKLAVSGSVYNLLGLTTEKKELDCFDYYLSKVDEADKPTLLKVFDEAEMHTMGVEIEHRMKHAYGHQIWLRLILKAHRAPRSNDLLLQGIIMDSTKSKLVEMELNKRQNLTQAVSLLTMKLITEDRLEFSIRQLLGTIGEAFDVSRTYLFQNQLDGASENSLSTSQIMEWSDKSVKSQEKNANLIGFNYVANGFARWVDLLAQGNVISGHIRNFPQPERKQLEVQDIQSLLVIPVFVGEDWWGFLGFDECRKERDWNPVDISYLTAIANLIGATLDKRKVHIELKQSESLYRTAADTLSDGLIVTGENGIIVSGNKSALKILKISAEHLLNKNALEVWKQQWNYFNDDGSVMNADENPLFKCLQNQSPLTDQILGIEQEASGKTWLMINAAPLSESEVEENDGMLISFCDITSLMEIKQRMRYLEQKISSGHSAYHEKISGDLRVLAGILRLQQLFSKNEYVLQHLKNSSSRIEILALAYDTVFSQGQFAGDRFGVYLDKVCDYCGRIYNAEARKIKVSCTYAESVMAHSESVACVLLIFEGISNSFQHAFKNRNEGEIKLSFQSQGDYHVVDLSDNGNGLPTHFNPDHSGTMGFTLMKSLAGNLNGALTIESGSGLHLVLTFPKRTF